MEITDPTPAERRVLEAFPRGDRLDFRTGPGDDPALGADWGPERTVRARLLRSLLLDGRRLDGEVAALRIAGARIVGPLELQGATIDCTVSFLACHFDRPPLLFGAQVRRWYLGQCVLPALHAGTLRTEGDLVLSDARIRGQVRLAGARIGGALFLKRARIGPVPPPSGDEPDLGSALQLNQIAVERDLVADGLRVQGETRLTGGAVTGTLRLNDAVLDHRGGTALEATTLTTGADLHAMRLTALGRVNLRGVQIPGQLNLAHARLANPGGVALRAGSITVGELWLREAERIQGSLTLRRAQLDLLHIAPETWPDQVRLDGLSYHSLDPHEPADRRLPVLERDTDGYVPYAYEQLTAAYRSIGDDAGARVVQLAKQRRHRGTLPWYGRLWGHLQDATVGYGFRPTRAAAWLLSLLLAGSLAYGLHPPEPYKTGEAPEFNAPFYALDLLLPIIDFGQERAYAPAGVLQWLSYGLIAAGWVLATTIAAGVTRAVSRQ
ncbi:membrane-associated oxidoreductase [Streptomyces triticagri]|uniref:Membrane-associated oxidoreductase n=1 Tax=Streptomyces triticagri TaxID=2293568 RepID=A0A372M460_9ACTN|nr:membrane-associated oxidoreductase [Streptomyces triticagri]RFU85253.1 membrane-associated oxidoreductase [Streptomyces triticagri]